MISPHEVPAAAEAAHRERIDREIEAGLRDLEAGNVVTTEEHEAEMDRFMAELEEGFERQITITRRVARKRRKVLSELAKNRLEQRRAGPFVDLESPKNRD